MGEEFGEAALCTWPSRTMWWGQGLDTKAWLLQAMLERTDSCPQRTVTRFYPKLLETGLGTPTLGIRFSGAGELQGLKGVTEEQTQWLQETVATNWNVKARGWFCGAKANDSPRDSAADRHITQAKKPVPSSSSSLTVSFSARYWQSLAWSQLAEQKCNVQPPNSKYRREGLEKREKTVNNHIMPPNKFENVGPHIFDMSTQENATWFDLFQVKVVLSSFHETRMFVCYKSSIK